MSDIIDIINGGSSGYDKSASKKQVILIGKVIDVDDPSRANRIRVEILGPDTIPLSNPAKDWSKEDMQVCFPFLPLHINIVPKKNELVKVIFFDIENRQFVREYIGPIVPQLGKSLIESYGLEDARKGRPDWHLGYDRSINNIITAKGVYPEKDEIAIQGRDNADIIFKPSEVLIRAAKFLPNEPTKLNKINPGYIQIKTVVPGKFETSLDSKTTSDSKFKKQLETENLKKTRTDINLVSNKIYLIGRDDNSSVIKPYFSEEEEIDIEDKLHPIVYGDILNNFIELLYNWINNHVHPYPGTPPNVGDPSFIALQKWKEKEFSKLNSKNIFAGGDFEGSGKNKKIKSKRLRGIGKEKLNDIKNKLVGQEVIRQNSFISRVDDILQPLVSVTATKVFDGNTCLFEFKIINNSSGEVMTTISGTNVVESLAYQQGKLNLNTYLLENGIVSKIYIPTIEEIKVF
jgi:hypothetical protein